MEVDLNRGDAVRLGVLDRRCKSARAMSKDVLGCNAVEGDRGVETAEVTLGGILGVEKDRDRSDVGVDSSIAGAVACDCPLAVCNCWSCCC
jgi:hypothetical protein